MVAEEELREAHKKHLEDMRHFYEVVVPKATHNNVVTISQPPVFYDFNDFCKKGLWQREKKR